MPAKCPPAHQQGTITKQFIVTSSKKNLYYRFSKAFLLKCSKPAETTLDQSSKGFRGDGLYLPYVLVRTLKLEKKVSNMPRVIPRVKRESCSPSLKGWR